MREIKRQLSEPTPAQAFHQMVAAELADKRMEWVEARADFRAYWHKRRYTPHRARGRVALGMIRILAAEVEALEKLEKAAAIKARRPVRISRRKILLSAKAVQTAPIPSIEGQEPVAISEWEFGELQTGDGYLVAKIWPDFKTLADWLWTKTVYLANTLHRGPDAPA